MGFFLVVAKVQLTMKRQAVMIGQQRVGFSQYPTSSLRWQLSDHTNLIKCTLYRIRKIEPRERVTIGYEWWAMRNCELVTNDELEDIYVFPCSDGTKIRFGEEPNVSLQNDHIQILRDQKSGEERIMSYDVWLRAVHRDTGKQIVVYSGLIKGQDNRVYRFTRQQVEMHPPSAESWETVD